LDLTLRAGLLLLDRLLRIALADDLELDPAIRRAALLRLVVRNRARLAVAHGLQPIRGDALGDQIRDHRLGASLREIQIRGVVALVRAALVGGRAGLVGARVVDVEHGVLVVVGIRAAVVVLEAVLVLGLLGALVVLVVDAVTVGVSDVGAAVLVLEAILGLG